MHKGDSVVVAATASGGEGKQGGARNAGEDFGGAGEGLGDNFKHLRFRGVFAGGHVGEEIGFTLALHDGEAGKSGIEGWI